MSLFNVGVGDHCRSDGRNTYGTIAQLEADLRHARNLGAPDNASVLGTAPGSIYAAEIQWISEEGS